MNTITVSPIPILQDNYVWTIIDTNNHHAVIVDPGEAMPVEKYLQQNNLTLAAILITHHHWDHTNGLLALKSKYQVPVFGPANDRVDGVDHKLREDDFVDLKNFPVSFKVFDIPGHTNGHIAYYGSGNLFCGDTLFAAGCGKLFEGTAKQMYSSLQKMAALPTNTKIYCGHEYTLNNLRFAEKVEPGNKKIADRKKQVALLRDKHLPSLPSTLAEEKDTNPFLRCNSAEIIHQAEKHAGVALENPADVFRVLREWKDSF